jgi:hypothetical protein
MLEQMTCPTCGNTVTKTINAKQLPVFSPSCPRPDCMCKVVNVAQKLQKTLEKNDPELLEQLNAYFPELLERLRRRIGDIN